MKSLRMQYRKPVLLLSGAIVWGTILVSIFNRNQSELHKLITSIWEQTITLDCQIRLTETVMEYISSPPLNKDSIGSVTIKTEKGIAKLNKKEIVIPANVEERRLRKHQTLLFEENPVRASRLDSLFKKNLYKKGIFAPTAVSYTFKDQKGMFTYQFSCPFDTLFNQKRVFINKIKTGVDNSIILRSFTRLTWIDYIQYDKTGLLIVLCCGLLVLLTIGIYYKRPSIKTQKVYILPVQKKTIPSNVKSETQDEVPIKTPDYKIIYHHFNRTFICNNESVTFPLLQGELFNILITSTNYQSNYEDMFQTLWPNGEGDKKKLEQLRKGLKERLKQFPIHIEVVRSTGYFLEIDEPYTIAEE